MKTYSGDVIRIIKDDTLDSLKVGDVLTVDYRQSDLGACDDEYVVAYDDLNSDISLHDSDYEVIEKVNKLHFRREIRNYLNYSDMQLLSAFKQGDAGESEFLKFMEIVRKFM